MLWFDEIWKEVERGAWMDGGVYYQRGRCVGLQKLWIYLFFLLLVALIHRSSWDVDRDLDCKYGKRGVLFRLGNFMFTYYLLSIDNPQ